MRFVATEADHLELTLDDEHPDQPELILILRDKDEQELHLTLEGAALRLVAGLALDMQKQFPAALGGH